MIAEYEFVRWLHVAVMGYWLGSDFVINALTHYVKNAKDLSFVQRMKLWDFLLLVDQHPRMALILSLPLGFHLAAGLDLSPIKGQGLTLFWAFSIVWFISIWVLHYQVGKPIYKRLSQIDLTVRYILIAVLLIIGAGSVLGDGPLLQKWLGAKVFLFAFIIFGGLRIRHYIAQVYAVIPKYKAEGSSPEIEAAITHALNWGSYVLFGMWVLIVAIGYLGAAKPF